MATWKDLSGNDNDAVLTNVAYTNTSGWSTNKIVLSGDENITFPIELPQAGTFSIEVVLTEHNYEIGGIIGTNKGWSSFHSHTWNNNGEIYIGISAYNNNRFTPNDISFKTTIGKTDYISYTYNGETREATFYANGIKLAQRTFTIDPEEITYFRIYASQKDYSRVSFYNKVLSEQEIQHNYSIDKNRFNITE